MTLRNSCAIVSSCRKICCSRPQHRAATHIRYRYTSFFWSRSPVAMFFSTSGNSAETSLPSVMAMMVFWIASLRSKAYCDTRPARSSKVSPLRGTANAPRIRLTACIVRSGDERGRGVAERVKKARREDRRPGRKEDWEREGAEISIPTPVYCLSRAIHRREREALRMGVRESRCDGDRPRRQSKWCCVDCRIETAVNGEQRFSGHSASGGLARARSCHLPGQWAGKFGADWALQPLEIQPAALGGVST